MHEVCVLTYIKIRSETLHMRHKKVLPHLDDYICDRRNFLCHCQYGVYDFLKVFDIYTIAT